MNYKERGRHIHELTIEQFALNLRVTPDDKLSPFQKAAIDRADGKLKSSFKDLDPTNPKVGEIFYHRDPELRFLVSERFLPPSLLMVSEDLKTLYGGISDGLTFLFDEHRGKGLSKHLHLAIDRRSRYFLEPSSYSESGYRCRLSAHKAAVNFALLDGIELRPEVLEPYRDVLPLAKEALQSRTPDCRMHDQVNLKN